jgi:hypothetical protein
MARGKQTRTLRQDQIERLEKFRRTSHDGANAGYSYPQLAIAMGKPCGWETLQNALKGRPVWVLIHGKLAEWIERYVPAQPLHDGKALAAGNGGDDPEEPVGEGEAGDVEKNSPATRTVRGSR